MSLFGAGVTAFLLPRATLGRGANEVIQIHQCLNRDDVPIQIATGRQPPCVIGNLACRANSFPIREKGGRSTCAYATVRTGLSDCACFVRLGASLTGRDGLHVGTPVLNSPARLF